MTAATALSRSGLAQAFGAYGLWGVLPLYFLLLQPAGAFEIVGWRILFSLVFATLLITAVRGWPALVTIVRDPRLLLTLGVAGVLIYINWQTYILAVLSGHVIEGALGYFINPIVTVLLAVLVLRERLRPAQWAAVGISVVAVLVIAIGYGRFPWISLILAFSFGFYGLLKNRVGPRVDAVSGLALESAWLTPIAVIQLFVVGSALTMGQAGAVHVVLLVLSGVVTGVPLLFFAGAARRLPLAVMGLIQYLAPVLQLVLGVVVLGEDMPLERWIGFALVWLALCILSLDALVSGRAARRVLPQLT